MKLTKYTHNPIAEIERAFDGFFNLTPVFHQLEEVYKTGDQVRFASEQTYNRSFSVGREFDLNKINFAYVDGVLEVDVPRRKKEEYIKTYSV